MAALLAAFEQREETVHQRGVLGGHITFLIQCGVEIEEVDNHRLPLVKHQVVVELVADLQHADLQVIEVALALLKLRGCEVHNGVEKQG